MKQFIFLTLSCVLVYIQIQAGDTFQNVNNVNIDKLLSVIKNVMQKHAKDMSQVEKFRKHNSLTCTQSKVLLKLREGIPEDVYTPEGWYIAPWASFVSVESDLYEIPEDKWHLYSRRYHFIRYEKEPSAKCTIIAQRLRGCLVKCI